MPAGASKPDLWDAEGVIVSDADGVMAISIECEPELRELPDQPWVTLSQAVSWIAFGSSMSSYGVCNLLKLSGEVERTLALRDISKAVADLIALGRRASIQLRGCYIEDPSTVDDRVGAMRIPVRDFEMFAQYHILKDALQCGYGITQSSFDPASEELHPWGLPAYHAVQVEREILFNRFRPERLAECKLPANRQLNHDEIVKRARAMLVERPNLSKGSAAASIVAELPPHPKTGKRRDTRHIERLIAPLWEGGI